MTESQEHFEDTMQEILSTEIPTEQPEELYKFAAKVECYSYYLAKRQAECERQLAANERALAETKRQIPLYKGTANDRQSLWEAETAILNSAVELSKSDVRYYKNLSSVLENKVSLIQSILSNISASIKAGAYLDGASRV